MKTLLIIFQNKELLALFPKTYAVFVQPFALFHVLHDRIRLESKNPFRNQKFFLLILITIMNPSNPLNEFN